MPSNSSIGSELRVALVVAAYAGSERRSTSHVLVEAFIPKILRRHPANVQLYAYVHCDVRDFDGSALIPNRMVDPSFLPKHMVKGHVRGHVQAAPCKLMSSGAPWVSMCKNRTGDTECSVEFLPNVGREAHVYLHHLLRVYASPRLADLTFFVQEGESQGLDTMLECAAGLVPMRACATLLRQQQQHVGSLEYYSPITFSASGIRNKSRTAEPDWSFLDVAVVDPLLRACRGATTGATRSHGSASTGGRAEWWETMTADSEGCQRPGWANGTASPPSDPLADRVAHILVRHQPSICRGVDEELLVTSPNSHCPRMGARGAFVVHAQAIRRAPFALLSALYAMSVSEEVVPQPGRHLTPCSIACFTEQAKSRRLSCGEWALAGDALAYLLEILWPFVFDVMLDGRCKSLNGSCVSEPDPRRAGLWCTRRDHQRE